MKAKPAGETGRKRRFPAGLFALRMGTGLYGEQILSGNAFFAAESRRFPFRTKSGKAPSGFPIRNRIVQILRKFAANSPTKPNCSFRRAV
jgi:hypothetical protein